MSSTAAVAEEFFETYHLLRKHVEAELSRSGLSLAKHKMLEVLAERSPCHSTDLATQLSYAPRTVTQAIDALERDGLAARTDDENDRRAKLVTLTKKGKEALATAKKIRARTIQHVFGSFSDRQCEDLSLACSKLRARIDTD